MFCMIEESGTNLVAKFGTGVCVQLSPGSEGDDSARVIGSNVFGPQNGSPTWYFTYSEHGEGDDGKVSAIAEAEQFFRDVVNAIIEDKTLNLTDFVMKPTKSKAKAKPKGTPAGEGDSTETETPAEQLSE